MAYKRDNRANVFQERENEKKQKGDGPRRSGLGNRELKREG